jgi:secreted trypsin-like serine protease
MFRLSRAKKAAAAVLAAAATVGALLVGAAPANAAVAPIVGGTTTTTTAYPYVVQITDSSQRQFCGGTLVSSTKIVTAAHCMAGETTSSVRVVGGRTYLNGTNGTVSRVSKIWIHPSYNSSTQSNDVSVLTLSTAMPYTPIGYVASTDTSYYTAGTTARILGWGTTSSGGYSSNQLRTATVPTVSNSSCTSSYGSEYISSTMVCAGYTSGGVDTCQGDSGGPLIINGKLAGITSWGYGCAEAAYPGVYTRLTTFSSVVTTQINS